jgi:endonuclease YncB( thermonuclease family)
MLCEAEAMQRFFNQAIQGVLSSSLSRTIIVSALISSAVLGGAVWYRRTSSVSPSAVRAEARPSPPATPPRTEPASPPSILVTLEPPYVIVDGLTVKTMDRVVRLAGLEGPPREAICFDEKGYLWACGLQARAALNNLITDRPVPCKVIGRDNDVDIGHCQVDRADLGRKLVAAGWARPTPDRQADHSAELKAASEASMGMWNGGWKIRPPRVSQPQGFH